MTEAEPLNKSKNTSTADTEETLTPQLLVSKYASAVLGLCIAWTKNYHDSEDIMQEVFLKAITKLNALKDPGRARTWLMQIARRMCIDHYNKHSMTQPISNDIPAPTKTEDERIERLHEAIIKLPDDYREPITLYYMDGHNCASVAQSLGISEYAVRSRLVRARLRLHEILSEDSEDIK